jgi:trehalose synthase
VIVHMPCLFRSTVREHHHVSGRRSHPQRLPAPLRVSRIRVRRIGVPWHDARAVLDLVDIGRRSLAAYRGVAPDDTLDEILRLAGQLEGARVLHLNATPYGGGVSELLRSAVPLLNDLGVIADWRIISGDRAFFEVTKRLHNALQGASETLTAAEEETYLANAERNASLLEESYDFVFVHDPQPAAIRTLHDRAGARWVWRCHIDTGAPNPRAWAFMRPFLADYDAAIFTMRTFIPPDLPVERQIVIPPAIDPLSPKNRPLDDQTAREILDWIGVEPDLPLITQVSRFDAWKDPLGVIEAYRMVRGRVPRLQLALVGSMALDDPEGWHVYEQIQAAAGTDPAIHVFTNLTGVGNIEVNAFQRRSALVVQKSIREGFGLVVSEALWKGTPVVAGRAGGIPLQVADGVGGTLVDDVRSCAAAIEELLTDPEQAHELAESGRGRVRRHFLLPRLLLNELELMLELARAQPIGRQPKRPGTPVDPVCGMALGSLIFELTDTVAGREYGFCSEQCRARFMAEPERYLTSGRDIAP